MLARLATAGALALLSSSAFAARYTLDPDHTQIVFQWNHFGFSNPEGQFGRIEGTLDFDPANPTASKVAVSIAIDSLRTNVAKLDEHLKGGDFFEAAKYPTATFKSTRVTKGVGADKLEVAGDLTVHGVTKPVTLDVTINKVGDQPMRKVAAAGFDATATIKRSAFGIAKYVPMVSDDIRLHITSEALAGGAADAGGAKRN